MLFDSYIFILVFLPTVLIGFFALSQKRQCQMVWVIFSSLFFYSWWNPSYLAIILCSILINYAIGYAIQTMCKTPIQTKFSLIGGISFNLIVLAFYKYVNFMVETANYVLSAQWELPSITLPLALSFFTFQQIAYLVDVSQRKVKHSSFLEYCFFICFFPQLIAGPIVHHQEIIPQLKKSYFRLFNLKNISIGLTIFTIGLFKKLALADSIAPYANAVFNQPEIGLTFFEAWSGALAYTFQLYFDFSGYSDMAIGLGRMFNVRLPKNFNSPYKAVNIIEFWRRWHMTLSRFLRDYLYIPLGGSRHGTARRYLNLMLTMLLGGLWHGASWTFVLWGGLHGLYLIINHGWQKLKLPFRHHFGYKLAAWAITFLVVVIAWVPFRAANFEATLLVWQSMLDITSITLPSFLEVQWPALSQSGLSFGGMFGNNVANWKIGVPLIVLLALISFSFFNTQQWFRQTPSKTLSTLIFKPNALWACGIGIALVVCLFLMSQESEFIYFQF